MESTSGVGGPIDGKGRSRALGLADRMEVARIQSLIALSTDEGDWATFLHCFTPDATGDYGSLGDDAMPRIVDAIRASQARYLGTMNFVGTQHAIASEDGIRATAYVVSHHFRKDDDGTAWDDHVGTRYVDDFVRQGSEWKIARRVAQVRWFRVDAITGGWI